ncbi:MAG: dihydroorotate dehydrogenase, partial [Halobacteria archaeon]|nr:dihydroorotate dehydrogenase [Halobacteria archaeon]
LVCRTINHGIGDYLDRHGLASVSALTGSLALNSPDSACHGG